MKKHYKTFLLFLVLLLAIGAIYFWLRPQNEPEQIREQFPYEKYVYCYAAVYDLEPALVFGVIRTESNFDPRATSHQNARGLMQITDETLNWAIAREGHEADYRGQDLYDPEVNIKYGCLILSSLLEEFADEETALAAYNAGRGNVLKWLKDSRYSADGKTIRKTPFKETNNYIKKVQKYQTIYRERIGENA